MGIGTNLQNLVSAEAAGLAAVIVIIFGIRFWLNKEIGKFIGALIVLAICLTFVIDPAVIITFLTGAVKKILSGSGGVICLYVRMTIFGR